ncbi:MAG: zinc ribbon domain-containing protein, partial [Candidatus Odinarchaeota archaeon]|nr:zinc ribbon domain-containing protein [Candidatus Odinarchaeota archaeon]
IALWILSGFVIGLITRKPSTGFLSGFYMATFFVMIYFALLFLNGMTVLPITIYGQFTFIITIVFPLIKNGFIAGFGGYIGGNITKPRKQIIAQLTEDILKTFPIKCPKCGFEMSSNALFCSNCGEPLGGNNKSLSEVKD